MFFDWSHGLVPWELASDHDLPFYMLENEIDMFGMHASHLWSWVGLLIGLTAWSLGSSLVIASCHALCRKARFTCLVYATALELAMFSDWPYGLVPCKRSHPALLYARKRD